MPFRVESRGMSESHELFIATVEEGAGEHSPGAIHYIPGHDSVTIVGNVPTWGATHVKGRDHIKMMRDALIEICRREGIE